MTKIVDSLKEEFKTEVKRSIEIWTLKEDFILKKSYKHNDSYRKEGTMLQKRDKNAHQTVQPKKRRKNYSRKKLQTQNNLNLEPMVKKEKCSPYQSTHEIEREYLQEMDEMVKCEESNTAFDKTKLEKLTKILEKLNEEDKDFEKGASQENARQDDAVERPFKKKLDDDRTPTTNDIGTHCRIDKQNKQKLPPVSKIPLPINKKKYDTTLTLALPNKMSYCSQISMKLELYLAHQLAGEVFTDKTKLVADK